MRPVSGSTYPVREPQMHQSRRIREAVRQGMGRRDVGGGYSPPPRRRLRCACRRRAGGRRAHPPTNCTLDDSLFIRDAEDKDMIQAAEEGPVEIGRHLVRRRRGNATGGLHPGLFLAEVQALHRVAPGGTQPSQMPTARCNRPCRAMSPQPGGRCSRSEPFQAFRSGALWQESHPGRIPCMASPQPHPCPFPSFCPSFRLSSSPSSPQPAALATLRGG